MKIKMIMKNRSHKQDINRTRLDSMMSTFNKQHLVTFEVQFIKNIKQQ